MGCEIFGTGEALDISSEVCSLMLPMNHTLSTGYPLSRCMFPFLPNPSWTRRSIIEATHHFEIVLVIEESTTFVTHVMLVQVMVLQIPGIVE